MNGTLTIAPAPLTVTAQNVDKVYGQAPDLSGFSTTGLVNGETVGSVSLASAGQPATASVAGSPYTITASDATGGTFVAGNYSISYVAGVLTVVAAAVEPPVEEPPVVEPPVVEPPVEEPPVVNPPVEEPPVVEPPVPDVPPDRPVVQAPGAVVVPELSLAPDRALVVIAPDDKGTEQPVIELPVDQPQALLELAPKAPVVPPAVLGVEADVTPAAPDARVQPMTPVEVPVRRLPLPAARPRKQDRN